MTTARRSVPALLLLMLVVLAALPAAAGAAGPVPQPQLGPLSPAFVEALHNPMVTLGLGRVPSPVEVKVGAAAEARSARLALPSTYDLRTEGRLTPVQDQGSDGTCWAFANIAAVESKVMSATPAPSPEPDYSEDNLVRRSGYYSSMYQRYNNGGYDFMAVAYFARWAGPVPESSDPYDHLAGTNGPVQAHVQGVDMIPGRTGPLDNDLVKQLVMENGALSVGMWVDQSYLDGSTNAYYDPNVDGEDHGVCIVGWDDDYPASNFGASLLEPAGPGAFLVRNSWGDAFGDGGYFWVSYYDQSFARDQGLGGLGGMSSYSDVESTTNYSREYQYDKLGVTAHVGYRSTSVWGANRFTAAADQTISAVSFYVLTGGTKYEVWTGGSLKTLRKRASGTADLPGYVTVPLTRSLMHVFRDKRFVVAVKLTSPSEKYPLASEKYPLAIEYPRASVGASGATASRGQSFISRNGTTWTDLTSLYPRSNVCLKAFAQ